MLSNFIGQLLILLPNVHVQQKYYVIATNVNFFFVNFDLF